MHTAPSKVGRGADLHRHPLTWLMAAVLFAAVVLLVRHDTSQTTGPSVLRGSGVASSVTRHVGSFSGVELAGSSDVVVRVGAAERVTVHGDTNLLRLVTTEVEGNRLVVATDGSFTAVAPLYVMVYVPTLDTVSLSGSGGLSVTGVEGRLLMVTLDGSGALRARGRVDRVDASLDGSGTLDLQRLVARTAYVSVSGSGQVWVNVTESLDASVPGTGSIVYSGNPSHVTRNVSGTGDVVADDPHPRKELQ
jgi:Putative auto-transporter adhesin, head GIN domain